jgi:hypothetical protein
MKPHGPAEYGLGTTDLNDSAADCVELCHIFHLLLLFSVHLHVSALQHIK